MNRQIEIKNEITRLKGLIDYYGKTYKDDIAETKIEKCKNKIIQLEKELECLSKKNL